MSIFGDIWDRLAGGDKARAEALARELDEWVAICRRWKQNSDTFNRLTETTQALTKDLGDADPLIQRAYDAQLFLAAQWDDIQAHNNRIFGWLNEAVRRGRLDASLVANYRDRINNAVGLGALPLFAIALAVAIIEVATAAAYAIVSQNNAKIKRDNDTASTLNQAYKQLADLRLGQSRKDGKTRDLPGYPEAPSGPIEKSVASLGIFAVVGVGLWAAATIFGGDRKK
jgi:hypothetical protein